MGNQENRLDTVQESRMENGSNTKTFLLGAFIGGVVGAATALFLSPKYGNEIRQTLNEQATLLKTKGEQLRHVAISKGNDLVDAAKERSTLNKDSENGAKKEHLTEVEYVSIKPFQSSSQEDLQKKLEETKKALEDEEQKIKAN
jgi:gas vesicle protein